MSDSARPDGESAIEIIRRYLSYSQKLAVTNRQADEIRRELESYGAATDVVRSKLTAEDQPASFAAVLGGDLSTEKKRSAQ